MVMPEGHLYSWVQIEIFHFQIDFADGALEEMYLIKLDGTGRCKGGLLIFYTCAP